MVCCGMKTFLWSKPRLPLATRIRSPNRFPALRTSTMSTQSSQTDQTFSLPDGRVLGYAEFGSPSGTPLLFFHGFPTSRLEGWSADKTAHRNNIRLIAPDRPGFGLSTYQPHRRIVDWPADVQALANHLQLSCFAILGGSGGGPYALACAHALPKESMSAVGIISGAGPWEAGSQDVPWSAWLTHLAATYTPTGLRVVTNGLIGMLRWMVNTGVVTKWIEDWLKRIGSKDEEGPSIEERRERLVHIGFDAFAQGAEGFVQEAQLLTQDWGFRFEDIEYNKIQMWHGQVDKQAPIRMIRYMAKRLPHCVLKEYEGENHFAVGKHVEEIMTELVQRQASQGER